MGAAESLQVELFPSLSVQEVDALHAARTGAYVALAGAADRSILMCHRRNPPETAEERAAMDRQLFERRRAFADAAAAFAAVPEDARVAWAKWVNGGRR